MEGRALLWKYIQQEEHKAQTTQYQQNSPNPVFQHQLLPLEIILLELVVTEVRSQRQVTPSRDLGGRFTNCPGSDSHGTSSLSAGAVAPSGNGVEGEQDRARQRDGSSARLTVLGSFSMMRRRVAAGPLTRRVPCSHFR